MLSRYWDNASPFALDLVGAVIRQGTFSKTYPKLTATTLHTTTSPDPNKNPHISAHNAVRPARSQYECSQRRLRKHHLNPPPNKTTTPNPTSMYAATPLVWGYPILVPYYAPYMW
ncbi:uncharacterized protein BO80DRAFT_425395 [Aspergillus ibericus CBS 121593]|uniref:Uncharacterized protein n=1 Tax=Aspergillus ibericus CBS 121593 TaxID=1448316 RepID=A0A395GZV9_9EURO|nr:hypothetical protein BO80DRAFT_425395 [Aspergillus ibericus CBS 121593]RAL00575.1 hypothetical protein BO80DRAFT_425395 [Aspergillus ibericus CBS 121593]